MLLRWVLTSTGRDGMTTFRHRKVSWLTKWYLGKLQRIFEAGVANGVEWHIGHCSIEELRVHVPS